MLARAVLIAAGAAITLVGDATGGPTGAKQRVAIEAVFSNYTDAGTFKFIPLSAGALKKDAGKYSASGNAGNSVIRKGQEVTLLTGTASYTSAQGSLYISYRAENVEAGGNSEIQTGTWTLLNATGVYEGYKGGGAFAGVTTPRGKPVNREEGYLSKP